MGCCFINSHVYTRTESGGWTRELFLYIHTQEKKKKKKKKKRKRRRKVKHYGWRIKTGAKIEK